MRLGVDVGGTFTDLVYVSDRGDVRIGKVPSRVNDPMEAIKEGLEQMGLALADVCEIVFGTTVATNTVIEKKGARTGLLCTEGFRDVLEHQRWHRRSMYDLQQTRPAPLVERALRIGIRERVSAAGEMLAAVNPAQVRAAVAALEAAGVESIAVCFMNSYRNGANEAAVRAALSNGRARKYVSLSVEVSPLIREWERTSTTVVNAYIQPVIDRYLGGLEQDLQAAAPAARLDIMQSNGGVISVAQAVTEPVRTILSGPAGGAMGAILVGSKAGQQDVIGMDMGGTSCDISVIRSGVPEVTKEGQVEYNVPIMVPMLNIETIGAGGGSLVWIDAGGVMKVGPQSAGAVPGPACYDRGGSQPTVTDAQLLLGRLPADGLLRGRMPVRLDLAEGAFAARICPQLGVSALQAAAGVIQIANIKMAEAIRLLTVNKGLDPRDFTLVPFGGAGPLHACEIAMELGIPRVLIPPAPGVLSALGLAGAGVKVGAVCALNTSLGALTAEAVEAHYRQLEERCRALLSEHGVPAEHQAFERSADLRYPGQSFEVTVPAEAGSGPGSLAALADRFHTTHRDLYKYAIPEETPFLVNIEVTARDRRTRPVLHPLAARAEAPAAGERRVYILEIGGWVTAPVYHREQLAPGQALAGPALIDQFDSTALIPPGFAGRVDAYGNIMVVRGNVA